MLKTYPTPPDKVAPSERDSAHTKFQEIAFAYAILSDERRRKRYDTTGNTSASLDIEDDDFNWADFFRVQFGDPQFKTKELDKFKNEYQGSDEEKRDVLAAHTKFSGDLNAVFTEIMFSNPLDDEERYRTYIDQAIAAGEVEAYHAYTHESPKKRAARHKAAAKEAREAGKLAEEMGVGGKEAKDGKKRKKTGKNDGGNEVDLATLIQRNQKSRSSIIDQLEAKYGGGKTSTNGRKRKLEEPPEEMFEKNRKLKDGSRPTPCKKTRKGNMEGDEEQAVNGEAFADREEQERPTNTKTEATRSTARGKKGTATKITK